MEMSRTDDGQASIILTADEATTLLVETLAARGDLPGLAGPVRARLAFTRTRSGTDEEALLFRLLVRPAPPAHGLAATPAAPASPASPGPAGDPTEDPAPDAFSAGTEL